MTAAEAVLSAQLAACSKSILEGKQYLMIRNRTAVKTLALALLAAWPTTLVLALPLNTPLVPAPMVIAAPDCEGAVISSITINVTDIFDDTTQGAFYSQANSLKKNTEPEVIKAELIISEGEEFTDFAASESARNLRHLGYLSNVLIEAKKDAAPSDTCAVTVNVQDTWTFIPTFGYSSGTGQKTVSAGLSESNLLGRGKRAELLFRDEDNRSSVEAVYEDPRVFNGAHRFLGAVFSREDGNREVFQYGLPYRTLLDLESWTSSIDTADTLGRLWKDGEEDYLFGQQRADLELSYSYALKRTPDRIKRAGLGWRYIEDSFRQATASDYEDLDLDPDEVSNDPARLADNRRFSGPEFTYQVIEPDFMSAQFVDRFERVQDFNLGREYLTSLMLAPSFTGSRNSTLLGNGNISQGHRFGDASFGRGEVGVASRYASGEFANTLARTQLFGAHGFEPRFIKERPFGSHAFVGRLVLEYGDRLDEDRQLLVGSDNSLRGYAEKSFGGDKRFVLNLEDRITIASNIAQLVTVGAAAFVDVGGASYNSLSTLFGDQLYSDIGVGLRFAFPRSSGGRVFRIDLAFPMRDGPDGSNRWEPRLLFSGGQLFDGLLRSERVGAEKTNVEVGVER